MQRAPVVGTARPAVTRRIAGAAPSRRLAGNSIGLAIAILLTLGLVGCGGNTAGHVSGSAAFPLPPPANQNVYQTVADKNGTLWMAGAAGLTAIDPASGHVEAKLASLGAPIAIGDGAIWATGRTGAIQEIDPVSRRPVGGATRVGRNVMALSASGGLVWALVKDSGRAKAIRIDAASRRILDGPAALPIPGDSAGDPQMAAAPDGVLVTGRPRTSANETAVYIAARTGRIRGTPTALPEGGTPVDTVAGFNRFWVLGGGTVFAIDARSGRIVGSRHLPLLDGIAVGARSVWLLELTDGDYVSVVRIDPKSLEIIGTPIRVDGTPGDIAAGGGHVWVITDRIRTIAP